MKDLDTLVKEKSNLIAKIKSFNDLMKGTVYLSKRKCSNPKCKCHLDKKYLHKSYVLTVTKNGKTHTLSLRREGVDEVRKLTENWKELKELVSELTDINMQIIKVKKELNKNKDSEKKTNNK